MLPVCTRHTAYVIICISIKTKYLKSKGIYGKLVKRFVFIIQRAFPNHIVCLKLNMFLTYKQKSRDLTTK